MVQPIVGMEFSIEGGAQPIRQKTGANGCLYWNDSVNFNYLGKEQYIQLERKVVAERPHRGEIVLDLAIDPWKTGGDALVDLRYGTSQALGSEADSSVSHSKLLILRCRRVFTISSSPVLASLFQGSFHSSPCLLEPVTTARKSRSSSHKVIFNSSSF